VYGNFTFNIPTTIHLSRFESSIMPIRSGESLSNAPTTSSNCRIVVAYALPHLPE
jgi:hypothetical protein